MGDESLRMELTYDDVLEILRIIDASDCQELHLEIGDFKLVVKKHAPGDAVSDAAASAAASPVPSPAGAEEAGGWPADHAEGTPPAPAEAVSRPASPDDLARAQRDGLHAVTAPMVGTFYRAPTPGAPPFVEVGSRVDPQDTVGLLEVMKLFTDISAGCKGCVVAICAENAQRVEHGQTLVVIEPSSG